MKHRDKDDHIERSRRRWLAGKLRAVVRAIDARQRDEETDDVPTFEHWPRKERAA